MKTNRRLWTEECRDGSIDSLVDLLEGYYRCRPEANRAAASSRGCDTSYSPLDYLGYLNKIGYAYATLPLRMMSQIYGGAPQAAHCPPADHVPTKCESLSVSSSCLCVVVEAAKVAITQFTIRGDEDDELEITFGGFKDDKRAANALALSYLDDAGDWQAFVAGTAAKLSLDGCKTLMLKVAAAALGKTCLKGKLRIVGVDTKVVTHVKLEVSSS
jgi:hypothetical protein